MNEIADQIKEKIEWLDEQKEAAAELRGQKQTLIKQLKDAGYKSVKAAKAAVITIGERILKIKGNLEKGLAVLEENFDWGE